MKIDFKQELFNKISGENIYEDATSKKVATLGTICVNALLTPINEDKEGKEKLTLWNLANKINGKEVEVTAEEIAKIKDRIGKLYAAAIVGITYELLEGVSVQKK